MTTAAQAIHHRLVPGDNECLHVVYVWQWPVRIAHWVIFLAIVVLSFTGYYMYDPFIISRGNQAFLMGTMRFIHEVAGFSLIAAFLLRAYWFFMGNKWARWKQFVLVGKERRKDLKQWLSYYLFLRRKTVPQVGHNPLAGLTYAVIYFLLAVEILTGMVLYNHILGNKAAGFFLGWLPALISIRYLREIHFLILFALWAFFIHHVYSAVLVGIEERTSGIVGSIFSGYKYITEAVLRDDALRNPDGNDIAAEGEPHSGANGKASA
ncbi:MAG: Ni/Fe-hydrogenase, b-type cytochrome subunit [Candidatus Acidiferrum sp.]